MSKKTLAIILTLGLLAGVMASSAEAGKKGKKKKPVPVEVQYFLTSNPDDACDEAGWVLAIAPSESAGCGMTHSGISNEVQIQAGADPRDLGQEFTAQEGLPIVLDASKAITGSITTRNFNNAGVGQPTVEITVFGTAGGEEIALGTHTATFPAAPTLMETHEFELDIDDKLQNAKLETLAVNVMIRGASVGHSVVEMNTPTSSITVPTLK